MTEGEWVSRHSWSRQWPVHTDFRELWQTCGNWTTFYKVLCAMVCRVQDKDFLLVLLSSLLCDLFASIQCFFSWLSFLSGVATAASLHPHGRHWLSITRTIWTSQLLRCSKISHLCLFIYFINMLYFTKVSHHYECAKWKLVNNNNKIKWCIKSMREIFKKISNRRFKCVHGRLI